MIVPGHCAGTTFKTFVVLFSSYAGQKPIPDLDHENDGDDGQDGCGDGDDDDTDGDGDDDDDEDFHLLASTRFSSRLIQATNQDTYF